MEKQDDTQILTEETELRAEYLKDLEIDDYIDGGSVQVAVMTGRAHSKPPTDGEAPRFAAAARGHGLGIQELMTKGLVALEQHPGKFITLDPLGLGQDLDIERSTREQAICIVCLISEIGAQDWGSAWRLEVLKVVDALTKIHGGTKTAKTGDQT